MLVTALSYYILSEAPWEDKTEMWGLNVYLRIKRGSTAWRAFVSYEVHELPRSWSWFVSSRICQWKRAFNSSCRLLLLFHTRKKSNGWERWADPSFATIDTRTFRSPTSPWSERFISCSVSSRTNYPLFLATSSDHWQPIIALHNKSTRQLFGWQRRFSCKVWDQQK